MGSRFTPIEKGQTMLETKAEKASQLTLDYYQLLDRVSPSLDPTFNNHHQCYHIAVDGILSH